MALPTLDRRRYLRPPDASFSSTEQINLNVTKPRHGIPELEDDYAVVEAGVAIRQALSSFDDLNTCTIAPKDFGHPMQAAAASAEDAAPGTTSPKAAYSLVRPAIFRDEVR